ncbi:MFS transporter [Sphaerisporangium sp. TRM90804]|uniref:MFS transporter n=1 Tax=Sphaerisporangium sp. TRM90804 TaxID=3031113 RepID=UPI00244CEC67|nr:MFS transporter [Sphaerisporangium sp. TRM90804]MDH2426784.1 MFS transporter [Sphaerisporangium sp. TRM90804]
MTVESAVIAAPRSRTRQLLATSAGNLVEWYDWLAYAFLATYFADQVFARSENRLVPLLSAFAVFAVGFVMRPVGGLVIGAVSDRLGRRTAMTLTIGLMGVGQVLMAALPTYAQVGLLSPLLLVLIRLIQGLSVGGEFAVSSVFLVESASPRRRGLFSSFSYFSSNLGQLLAAGVTALLSSMLSSSEMTSWGWRLPFALGAVACLAGLWIRHGTDETYLQAKAIREGRVARPGLFDFLRLHPRESLLVAGMTVGATVSFYTWSIYLPTYAEITVGADPGTALTASTVALAFFTAIQPLGGLLSDRIGRKPLLIVFGGGFTVLTVPLLALLQNSFWNLLLIMCVAMVLLTGYTAVCSAVMVELFPARVRTTGIGFPYAVTVAAFGGTAPYIATALADNGHGSLFGWYATALTLVSTIVYIRMRETRGTPLG